MASKRDYYEILGVSKASTDDEVKKAYRTLAKKYHPDVSKESNAEAKFKEVQEAYECLSDPQKKAAYDQYGHDGPNMHQGFGGGHEGFSDFSDIFSQMFNFGQNSNQSRRSTGPRRGADIQESVTLDFLEAALGCSKTFSYSIECDCKNCKGTGAKSPKDVHVCSTCKGNGSVYTTRNTMFGQMREERICSTCGGQGKTITNKCESCHGKGRIKEKKTLTVEIKAGVTNDINLRVANAGNQGNQGAGDGDLYIHIRVRPHKVFKRNGNDIIVDNVPLSFTQAALGTKIEIPTIYGDAILNIPAGTDSETRFRIKEKGIADFSTKRKGDMYISVKVVTPKNLTGQQKNILEDFEKKSFSENESTWKKFKNLFKK